MKVVYVDIKPYTAMPRRFISLAELKKDLGVSGTEDDPKIQEYLDHATEAIMKQIEMGRPGWLPGEGETQERSSEPAASRVGPTIAGITEQTSFAPDSFFKGWSYTWVEMPWTAELGALSPQVARMPEPEADEPAIVEGKGDNPNA